MSFLSSHRLHWGEHDALTGHLFTHLEVHLHDLPLAPAEGLPPSPSATYETAKPQTPATTTPPPSLGLPDIPGP